MRFDRAGCSGGWRLLHGHSMAVKKLLLGVHGHSMDVPASMAVQLR